MKYFQLTNLNNYFNTIRNCVFFLVLIILFSSCKKNTGQSPGLPFNPFDTITYNQNVVPPVVVDSNSFLGIHKYILSVKCAVSGCHDGSFEPDYRTVQSAYNTLVYAPVLKNTDDSFYTYRVLPFDTAHSWLWYRLTTTDATLGRMPLYDTLYPAQREKISNWILDGAPDIFGNSPAKPTYEPAFFGVIAYLPDLNNFRVDTMRGGIITNPFMVPHNTNVKVWFGLYDDITLPFQFTYNKVKLSTDLFNWDNAIELSLQTQFTAHYESLFDNYVPFFDYFTLNTSLFNQNDIVYMRVYVQDADHPSPTELQDKGSQLYIQTYCSFIVQ